VTDTITQQRALCCFIQRKCLSCFLLTTCNEYNPGQLLYKFVSHPHRMFQFQKHGRIFPLIYMKLIRLEPVHVYNDEETVLCDVTKVQRNRLAVSTHYTVTLIIFNFESCSYTFILLLHPIICAAGSYLPDNYGFSLDITQFMEQDHREITRCSETL